MYITMYTTKEEIKYYKMTAKQLLKLKDKEFVKAVAKRRANKELEQIMKQGLSKEEIKKNMSEPELVVKCIWYFYCDVIEHEKLDIEELGLRLYLAEYSREEHIPYLSESLEAIGAYEYKKVFDDFLVQNNIDVNDLSAFAKIIDKDYYKQAEVYHFEDTDRKIREMSGLLPLLAKYIKEHMELFATDDKQVKPKNDSVGGKLKKKTYALNLLKKILIALHEKRFEDVVSLVDESTLNAEDMEECIQGTVEINEYRTMDKYIAKNLAGFEVNEDSFYIEYYITADGGNDLPLILIIDFTCNDDGSIKACLNIDAN